ncbi:MAG TPA: chromate transporter, partial [Clostridia bacterium]|nr:chromate transporter [Clostridia bacterium]
MILWQLFLAFLEVGTFAFGGGYAALPLIEKTVVVRHGWLTIQEMTDVIAISQVTPGPIALNAATFVGTRLAGIPGAIVASCAAVL